MNNNQGIILKDDIITLRILKDDENDYRYLEKWYQSEEINSHFEQRILSFDEIEKKYQPRTSLSSKIPVFMIEYNEEPIGIIQYQLINEENKKLYGIINNHSYEIDIFIGNISLHNKGIGRKTINLISNYLFYKINADMLVMCPLSNNKSAIKCYENCGFRIKGKFKTENTIGDIQEYVLMMKEK